VKLLVDVLGDVAVAHQAGCGRLSYVDGLAGGRAPRDIAGFVLGAVVHARLAGRPCAEPAQLDDVGELVGDLLARRCGAVERHHLASALASGQRTRAGAAGAAELDVDRAEVLAERTLQLGLVRQLAGRGIRRLAVPRRQLLGEGALARPELGYASWLEGVLDQVGRTRLLLQSTTHLLHLLALRVY
jgi:hypothetical protein